MSALNLAVLLAAMAGSRAARAGEPAKPARPASRRVAVDLLEPASAEKPALRVLGGRQVEALLVGPQAAQAVWAFAFEQTVLRQGQVTLNDEGWGKLVLDLPVVRHRADCRLVFSAGPVTALRPMTILPGEALALAAERIAAWRLGVFDPAGSVRQALSEQRIAYRPIATKAERDAFTGGAMLLVGAGSGESLAAEGSRLAEQMEEGMTVILVNPPPGWGGWGLRCQKIALDAAVQLAEPLSRRVNASDLGSGPWTTALKADAGVDPLAWLEAPPTTAPTQPNEAAPAARPTLVAARPVGRGRLIVATLPILDDPAGDAVGRVMLNEIILHALAATDETKPKEQVK